eukprot:GEZU01003232.1.p1 GENE.GEZU01003232.1~~GEZU01003232.1.p1  ORF type:complete len:562 (-),score=65.45 GEZU01003232.1:88-1773(-)
MRLTGGTLIPTSAVALVAIMILALSASLSHLCFCNVLPVYVDPEQGSDTNADCSSIATPCASISGALKHNANATEVMVLLTPNANYEGVENCNITVPPNLSFLHIQTPNNTGRANLICDDRGDNEGASSMFQFAPVLRQPLQFYLYDVNVIGAWVPVVSCQQPNCTSISLINCGFYNNTKGILLHSCYDTRDPAASNTCTSQISRCDIDGNNAPINVTYVSQFQLSYSNVTSNAGVQYTVWVYQVPVVVVTNTTFRANRYVNSVLSVSWFTGLYLQGSSFVDNINTYGASQAQSPLSITFSASSLFARIDGTAFVNCSSRYGGAVLISYIYVASSASMVPTATFTNCSFVGNRATESGGAVYIIAPLGPNLAWNDVVTFEGTLFEGNVAEVTHPLVGFTSWVSNDNMVFSNNCIIRDNNCAPTSCSGNGVCNFATGLCECYSNATLGYFMSPKHGPFSSLDLVSSYCSMCQPNYYSAETCTRYCTKNETCGNKGYCDENGYCHCSTLHFYKGPDCQELNTGLIVGISVSSFIAIIVLGIGAFFVAVRRIRTLRRKIYNQIY